VIAPLAWTAPPALRNVPNKHALDDGLLPLQTKQRRDHSFRLADKSCGLNRSMQHHPICMAQGKRANLSATHRSEICCRWKAGHWLYEIERALGQGQGPRKTFGLRLLRVVLVLR
jgi:hypothetical protein